MSMIGNFKASENGFAGTIETLALRAEVNFERVQQKSNAKSPDFRIYIQGTNYDIGAAWEKPSAEEGASYLSVQLDDPSLAAPIRCRLVKTGAEHGYSLLWDRKR
jgi:uncharacterized protein (DUF736 family)